MSGHALARAGGTSVTRFHVNGQRLRQLEIERLDKLPLTLNISNQTAKNVWITRKELSDWRAWSAVQARAGNVEPLTRPVTVTVVHLRKNRASMPDTGAPILAAKAVIDGLVDAGVLREDGPMVVRRLTFEAPVVAGRHGLRVTLTELPGPVTS